MTICNWCGVSGDLNLVDYEGYGRLCHGCRFCVKHGAPRRTDEDQPFTEERKKSEAFIKKFFEEAEKIARLCGGPRVGAA